MSEHLILDIKQLISGKSFYEYEDDNFVISDNIIDLFQQYPAFRTTFFGLIFCTEGCVQLSINGHEHLIQKNELCLFFPTNLLSESIFSSDSKIWLIGITQTFFNGIIRKDKMADNTIAYLYNNPIRRLEFSEYGERIAEILIDFLKNKIVDSDEYYKKDLIGYIISAMLCEILIECRRKNRDNKFKCDATSDCRTEVFKRFIKEVSKDDGRHRSVSYYADKLCYSSKYISSSVKSVSGRTPLEWITDHVLDLIKYRLKYSSLSIKEVGNEFEFPTPAFFGKYFKEHTGMTPLEFRKSIKR